MLVPTQFSILIYEVMFITTLEKFKNKKKLNKT